MKFVKRAGQVRVRVGTGVTITSKEQVFVPQALVAVQVTVFVPRGNALPLAGTQRRSAPPVTMGLVNVTVAEELQVAFVMDAGQLRVMATAGISVTVTLNEQVLEPQALVAVQMTAFVPKGNTLPLTGTQPTSAPPVTVGFV